MSLGKKIITARKKRSMTQEELATSIGMTGASLSGWESDRLKNQPDPRTLIRLSSVLNAPELLIHHCETCLVRQHIFIKYFPDLNNIRNDPAVIASRLRKEMVEATEALDRLAERFSDADFKTRPDYQEVFEREMEQVFDVKRGIEILEFQLLLSGLHSQEDLASVYERQQRKCEAHGHHKAMKEVA